MATFKIPVVLLIKTKRFDILNACLRYDMSHKLLKIVSFWPTLYRDNTRSMIERFRWLLQGRGMLCVRQIVFLPSGD